MGKVFDWPFLQEPIWRWFLFLIAISLFMGTWYNVLGHIRAAE